MMMEKKDAKTAIINVNIFDGMEVNGRQTVVFENGIISGIGGKISEDRKIVDGSDCRLLPGLFDSHVHTSVDGLREALKFGITTELEMTGGFTQTGTDLQLK